MERVLITIAVLVAPGIFLMVYGFWLIRGGRKATFMARHIYAGRAYMYIPTGLMLLFWALATIPQSSNVATMIVLIGVFFGGLALICAFMQPSVLKPDWYKWLEQEHQEILHLLCDEVRRIGDRKWQRQMKTQEDMEKWVAEVRRKHGLS